MYMLIVIWKPQRYLPSPLFMNHNNFFVVNVIVLRLSDNFNAIVQWCSTIDFVSLKDDISKRKEIEIPSTLKRFETKSFLQQICKIETEKTRLCTITAHNLGAFQQSSETTLNCIIWKENGCTYVNNASESHKLITLYMLKLLLLKTAFYTVR